MSDMPQVLNVIDSLSGGGAELHLAKLCQRLRGGPYASDVFSISSADPVYAADLEAAGCKVIFGASHHWNVLRIAMRLAVTIQRGHYRVLHLYLPLASLIGTIVGRMCGVPIIITAVCARKAQFHSFLLPFRNYACLNPWTDIFTTRYPSELENVGIPTSKIRCPFFLVNMEFDGNRLAHEGNSTILREGINDDFPIILSAARLHPDKGQEFVIRAMPRVMQSWPSAQLLIFGQGSDEARLRKLTIEVGVERAVRFEGFHRDLHKVLEMADIFVSTSVNEVFNGSYLAAMAHGVATVAFDTGYNDEDLPFKDGISMRSPLRDVAGLEQSLLRLSGDALLRAKVGKAGQEYISQFDTAHVVRNYERLYAELMAMLSSRESKHARITS